MKGSPFQRKVAEFVTVHELEIPIPFRVLDLAAEAGELAKEVLTATDYGRSSFRPSEMWQAELGDVFFALVCLANSTGVDLEEALERALDRYRERLAQKGDPGSGR